MRSNSIIRLVLVAIAGLFVANRVSAQTYNLMADLDPGSEIPPHNTPGYGSADLTLNVGTSTISINAGTGTYSDLLGTTTSVRLQDAPAGSNGPTIGPFTLDNPGTTSGTFSGSIASLTAAQMNDIIAGNTYINIADSVYPSGEIRGQVVIAPEPTTLGLLAGGSLLLMRRRARV